MRAVKLAFLIVSATAYGSELPAFLAEFAERANEKLTHLGPYMRQVVKETIKKHELPVTLPKDLLPSNDTDACKPCMEKTSEFVIEKSLTKLKGMCEKANSCKSKKICGFLNRHEKMTVGMMIEHVRPMALSAAFCIGKDACKPTAQIEDEVFQGKEAHEALMDHYDNLDLDGVGDRIEGLVPEAEDEEEEEKDGVDVVRELDHDWQCQDEHHHMHVCPHCMKRAIRFIMGHSVKKVHEMCASTDCPKAQRLCKFARDHREVAFGMLVMKVEPWKAAFGFCVAMGKGKGKGKVKGKHHHGKFKGKGNDNGKGREKSGKFKGWMPEGLYSVVV